MKELKSFYMGFEKDRLADECIRASFIIKNLQAYVTKKQFLNLYDEAIAEMRKCEAKGDYTTVVKFKEGISDEDNGY